MPICSNSQKQVYQSFEYKDNLDYSQALDSRNLEEDLNYIRSVLKRMHGGDTWYDTSTTLGDVIRDFLDHIKNPDGHDLLSAMRIPTGGRNLVPYGWPNELYSGFWEASLGSGVFVNPTQEGTLSVDGQISWGFSEPEQRAAVNYWIPINPARTYTAEVWINRISGSCTLSMGIDCYSRTRTYLGTRWCAANGLTVSTDDAHVGVKGNITGFGSGDNAFPNGTRFAKLVVMVERLGVGTVVLDTPELYGRQVTQVIAPPEPPTPVEPEEPEEEEEEVPTDSTITKIDFVDPVDINQDDTQAVARSSVNHNVFPRVLRIEETFDTTNFRNEDLTNAQWIGDGALRARISPSASTEWPFSNGFTKVSGTGSATSQTLTIGGTSTSSTEDVHSYSSATVRTDPWIVESLSAYGRSFSDPTSNWHHSFRPSPSAAVISSFGIPSNESWRISLREIVVFSFSNGTTASATSLIPNQAWLNGGGSTSSSGANLPLYIGLPDRSILQGTTVSVSYSAGWRCLSAINSGSSPATTSGITSISNYTSQTVATTGACTVPSAPSLFSLRYINPTVPSSGIYRTNDMNFTGTGIDSVTLESISGYPINARTRYFNPSTNNYGSWTGYTQLATTTGGNKRYYNLSHLHGAQAQNAEQKIQIEFSNTSTANSPVTIGGGKFTINSLESGFSEGTAVSLEYDTEFDSPIYLGFNSTQALNAGSIETEFSFRGDESGEEEVELTGVVSYVGSTEESYTNSSSVSRTVPSNTQPGDLIIAAFFYRTTSSNSITPPTGFTMLHEQPHPEPQSVGQVLQLWTKTADATDANSTVSFSQTSPERLALSLLVLRSTTGEVALDDLESLQMQNTSGSPGLHPVPRPISSTTGGVAVSVSSCTLAAAFFSIHYRSPSGWELTTREFDTNNRLSVAYQNVPLGQIPPGLSHSHDAGGHNGSAICAIFRAGGTGTEAGWSNWGYNINTGSGNRFIRFRYLLNPALTNTSPVVSNLEIEYKEHDPSVLTTRTMPIAVAANYIRWYGASFSRGSATDVEIEVSADNGANWTLAPSSGEPVPVEIGTTGLARITFLSNEVTLDEITFEFIP